MRTARMRSPRPAAAAALHAQLQLHAQVTMPLDPVDHNYNVLNVQCSKCYKCLISRQRTYFHVFKLTLAASAMVRIPVPTQCMPSYEDIYSGLQAFYLSFAASRNLLSFSRKLSGCAGSSPSSPTAPSCGGPSPAFAKCSWLWSGAFSGSTCITRLLDARA